jgi:hypothetical protein
MNRTLLWIGAIMAVVGGLAFLIGSIIANQRPAPNAGVVEGLWSLYGLPFLVFGGYTLVAGLAIVILHYVLRLLVYVWTNSGLDSIAATVTTFDRVDAGCRPIGAPAIR